MRILIACVVVLGACTEIDQGQGETASELTPAAAAVTGVTGKRGTSAAPITTVPIAINGPRVGASPGFQGDALVMSGPVQSEVFQIAGIPVGSVITGAHVRVRDNAVGPTRLNVILYPSVDGSQGPPVATSSTSSGTGEAQTLTLSGFSAKVMPLVTYSIYVNMTTGSEPCAVLGIDVDFTP